MIKVTNRFRLSTTERYSRFLRPKQTRIGKQRTARTPRGFYRELHKIADKARPKVRREVLDAFERMQGKFTLREIQRAVEAQDVDEVLRLMKTGEIEAELEPVYAATVEVFIAAGKASEKIIPDRFVEKGVALRGRFNITNPHAVEFLRNYKFDLIQGISDRTREGIRQTILDAFEQGGHPYMQAQKIKRRIGLTRRQATALSTYQAGLVAEGVRPNRVDRMVRAYRSRLKEQRANAIARTETIRASSEGQQSMWDQAMDEGLIDPNEVRRKWIVTPDDRLCPICREIPKMNKNGVGMKEPFRTSLGARMTPPAHPNCRCGVGLIEAEEE